MSTTDRRAFLETALAATALAALRPRAAAAAGPIRKAVELSMLPKELSSASASRWRATRLRRHRDADDLRPEGGRRAQGRRAEDRARDPLRDEHGALAFPLSSADPARGREERRRAWRRRCATRSSGAPSRAAGAGGRERETVVPGRLDALAEGHPRAHPAARQRAQGRHRGSRRSGTSSCSARSSSRATWTSSPRPGSRPTSTSATCVFYGFPQDWIRTLGPRIVTVHLKDFQLDRAERQVHLEEPRRRRHRLARGAQGASPTSATRAG